VLLPPPTHTPLTPCAGGRWQRVLLALLAALITVVAEGWLFVRYADTPALEPRVRTGAATPLGHGRSPARRAVVPGAVPGGLIPGLVTRTSSASSLASTGTAASTDTIELRPLVGGATAGGGRR
jgi:hypothetical protein